jgi:hypothetical protein
MYFGWFPVFSKKILKKSECRICVIARHNARLLQYADLKNHDNLRMSVTPNSMGQSFLRSWKSASLSKKLLRHLWNSKFHYCSQEPDTGHTIWILSALRHSTNISLRSILILSSPPHLDLPRCLWSSGFTTKTLYAFLVIPFACYKLRPSNHP